jgi:hypothetical protein
MTGYVLIQAEVGMAKDVGAALSSVEGVTGVDMVTGPYDVIARTEARDFQHLGSVVSKIEAVAGIARTLTCSVLHV